MALTVVTTGTLTADGTVQTIGAAQTAAGVYVLQVDLVNMAAADLVTLRTIVKVLTGSTAHVLYRAVFSNMQPYPVVQTPPIAVPYEVTFTLQQTGAGYRNFDWAILKL